MAWTYQFVDRIDASPTVRLDLTAAWFVTGESELAPPGLRRSATSTLLADGEQYPAAAYGNRTLHLVLEARDPGDKDALASAVQALLRELNRPSNILKYQPGTSAPVFFRTFRAGPESVRWSAASGRVIADIPAEPFALGLRENLPQVTVYADPAEGVTISVNPNFDANTTGWTALGGSLAWTTAQFHLAAGALLLTPDGVTATAEARASSMVAVTPLQTYRFSAWVRCAVARTVTVAVNWHDTGGGFLSTSTASASVAANTWTYIEGFADAPASATQARLIGGSMGSTPLTSHLLYVDEARLRAAGGVGGCCFDVTGIKGDVETPLYISVPSTNSNFVTSSPDSSRVTAIAVRRRGNPSQAPFVLQAEAMSMSSTDTTVQANNPVFSGSGSNFVRTTFATTASMSARLQIANWPSGASVDVRGQYRVFMRYRASQLSPGQMQARLRWGTSNTSIANDTVDLIRGYGGAGGPYVLYADLGIVQFPQGYDPVSDGPDGVELPVEGMGLFVDAARISGSASLDIDLLLFVPADDRLLLVTWPGSPTLPTTLNLDSDKGQVYVEGASGVLGRSGAQLAGGPPMVSPGVTNRITWVRDVGMTSSTGSGAQGDDITATTIVAPYYWPKYLAVRPPMS